MLSIVFGFLCLVFAIFIVVPFSFGLNWTEEFIFVLKGALPIFAILLGLLCVLVGLADVIDKRHAKKEALIQEEFEKQKHTNN